FGVGSDGRFGVGSDGRFGIGGDTTTGTRNGELPTPPSSSGTGSSPVSQGQAQRLVPIRSLVGAPEGPSRVLEAYVGGGALAASRVGSSRTSSDASRAPSASALANGTSPSPRVPSEVARASPSLVNTGVPQLSPPPSGRQSASTTAHVSPPQPKRSPARGHPAHPGPIALPPATFGIPTSPAPAPAPASPFYASPYVLPSPMHAPAHFAIVHPHTPLAQAYSPVLSHAHHPQQHSPLPFVPPPGPQQYSGSPLHHPFALGMLVTPHGLPPITPSMPSFQFHHPPAQPQHVAGAVFSPGLSMSEGEGAGGLF
ncbi:hypothetical protein K488DRAFT_92885, partial [Vararia minispora EC-137]